MRSGTAILLGFLTGVVVAPIVYRAIQGRGMQAPSQTKYPAKTKAPYAATRAISGVSWDCTQQDWLQKNIIRYNNPFGG